MARDFVSQAGRYWLAAILCASLLSFICGAQSAYSQTPEPGLQTTSSTASTVQPLNFFDLLMMGRYWMLPILLMSLVVGTCVVERWIGLRKSRILPRRLAKRLTELAASPEGFEPGKVAQLCGNFPSAAANVVQAMLAKVGRPHSEVEQAVREAEQREASRLYANIRWLNLAAAVTPLMGLLGTVWGMIRAFHDTTQLGPGGNKADHLAEGIYVALVTTLGGLMVAIPAAIFAHYFEGRIQKAFLEIEELLFSLMPTVERFEGAGSGSVPAPAQTQVPTQVSATVEPPPIQTPVRQPPVPGNG